MIYPEEIFSGDAGATPPAGVVINPVFNNNNNIVNDCNAYANAELTMMDGAFSPTYNIAVTIPTNVHIDGDSLNWPEIVIPPDAIDIVINPDGSISGGDSMPEGARIVSIKPKTLYSSVLNNPQYLAKVWREALKILNPGGTENTIEGIIQNMYSNSFRQWYVRFFTYGEKEKLTPGLDSVLGFGVEDAGTGGSFEEAFKPIFAELTDGPYPTTESGLTPDKVLLNEGLFASILETNIKREAVWSGQITVPCSECSNYVNLKERGIANDIYTGFAIKRLVFEIEKMNPFENQTMWDYILHEYLLSGILRIERLRTRFHDTTGAGGLYPYIPNPFRFWENQKCCLPDGNFAAEDIRHQFLWEPLYDIPVKEIYMPNPRPNIFNKSMEAETILWDGENQKWTLSDGSIEVNTIYYINQIQAKELEVPIFIAPGTIWRARLIFDPRKTAWLFYRLITALPTSSEYKLPIGLPDFRARLILDGVKIIYDWDTPEVKKEEKKEEPKK